MQAPIVLLAHGSPDPRHGVGVEALAGQVRALVPGRPVAVAYLDHHPPTPAEAAAELAEGAVVPVLLTRAYHARVDVPAAVATMGAGFVAAGALGPDPALLQGVEELLARGGIGAARDLTVVLFAAGSSDSAAVAAIVDTVASSPPRGWAPWQVAALDGGQALSEVVADLDPARVVVVSFMVADGILRDRMAQACTQVGLALVPGTLGETTAVAALAVRRADVALASLTP